MVLSRYNSGDLCSTCDHHDLCAGRSTPQRPIFFCEQFEIFSAAPAVPAVPAAAPHAAAPERVRPKRAANVTTGLCVNCDNADGCSTPKPEGGVWHCEEYR